MRSSLTLSALLTFGCMHGQQLTNVVPFPSVPSHCMPVRFIFSGVMPSQASISTFNYSETGNTITFDLYANGGGQQVAFSHPIEFFGPYPTGTYNLVVNLRHNGNGIDNTWTGSFQVTGGTWNIGEYGTRTVCNTVPPFPLADVVEGLLDPGGVWTDPYGIVVPSGMFVPGVSIEGSYMYVLGVDGQPPPCEPAVQFVDVYYTPNNSAGIGGPVQACSVAGGHTVDLFDALGGDPMTGGTWNGPTPLGGANGAIYTPGVNTPGAYTYTVPGLAPCPNHTVTMTVQGVAPPNAGNGSTVTLCAQDTGNVLNVNVTGEQTTGSWYDPNGFLIGGYNQPLNIAATGSGRYVYVVSNGVCPNDSAFVNLTVLQQPCGVGVAELEGDVTGLLLVPNPAHDRVSIELLSNAGGGTRTLELFDLNGRMVHRNTAPGNETSSRWQLELDALAPGLYLVRATTAAGRAVARLTVQ